MADKLIAGRVMLIPRGDWDVNETYSILDMVNDDETTYIARGTSQGVKPSTDPSLWFVYHIKRKSDTTTDDVEAAFNYVFSGTTPIPGGDPTAMASLDITNALNTPWDGSSSQDPTAMQAADVEHSINTPWDGSSSQDPTAMQSNDVSNAIQ